MAEYVLSYISGTKGKMKDHGYPMPWETTIYQIICELIGFVHLDIKVAYVPNLRFK